MSLKLGKLPARPGAVKLKLVNYLDTSVLPKPPREFGHERLVTDWGMLGNDAWGDCVWAGWGHNFMLWNREAGRSVNITTQSTLRNYEIVTGFNPNDPSTDQGTDMEVAAKYVRQTGLLDADGKRHKIGAYVALEPGNVTQLWYALYLFDGVGIGVEFPAQWMDAFRNGRTWGRVRRPKIEGGHFISAVARRARKPIAITWARPQPLTIGGYTQFNDETQAYLTEEKLTAGKSLEGFDLAALKADLAAVTAA